MVLVTSLTLLMTETPGPPPEQTASVKAPRSAVQPWPRRLSRDPLCLLGPARPSASTHSQPLQGQTQVPVATLRRTSRCLPLPPKSSQACRDLSAAWALAGRALVHVGDRCAWEAGKSSGRKVRT